ncbi:hypothetical protein POTOM_013155 [Populus tomentosa]|uniref:Uncharacterized protein n=1 Tax=Populus tomentosa TaxID=118781 RepID=A0A8X8A233_POPTO|nr:hypothetical protein POTOM_013155 [Populus tomentosa]
MQNCMASNGVQSYAGLQAALPPVSGVTQTIPNTVVQNPNMQSIPGVSQNSVGNSMGQGIPSTMFVNFMQNCQVMLFLVALCATASHMALEMPLVALCATCGISNATAIETIAITHEFVTTSYPPEWLRVHGDHVKSEAVEKAITQIMMGEEAEEMSSRAKKRPRRLLKKVDLLAPISML